MNDDKIDPKLRTILSKLPANTVKIEDPRYEIFYPNINGYCDGIGYYRSYMYNGASIDTFNDEKNPVRYEIDDDDTHKRINCVRLIFHERKKLGDIFNHLPYGVIKKNIPGIGATTLSLQQLSHTIIVVPTRALAYAKYVTGYNNNKTKNRYLYVGSDINECRKPTDEQIYEYLTQKVDPGTYKKIIVVADSLGRVMKQIQYIEDAPSRLAKVIEKHWEETHTPMEISSEDLYSHSLRWYLMVDEIDSYQSDGVFRPAMENVIDYYFTFPERQRCLVSATIRPFSNPQLQEEPVLELNYEEKDRRDVELINTTNIHIEVCNAIRHLRENFFTDKIVVAYNSITSIQKIIAQLPKELQKECHIACSPDSKEKAGEFFTVLQRNLAKPITFITCSYFVGVDIKERFHLISVSDVRQIYTILSIDKLYQISGRCRHEAGLLSEAIIYNSANKDAKDYGEFLVQRALDLSQDICSLSNVVNKLHEKHPELLSENFLRLKDDIVDRTKQSYYGSSPIEIVRVNKDQEIVPAYFNVDAIAEYAFLRGHLYSNPKILHNELLKSCNITFYDERDPAFTDIQKEIEDAIDDQFENKRLASISEVIEKLKELRLQNKLTDASIAHLRRNRHREDYKFIDRFSELYKYVPFDILVAKLQEGNAKTYRGFMRSAKYLALSEKHAFKQLIKGSFEINKRYTQTEILERLNVIFEREDIPKLGGTYQAVQELHYFCTTTRPQNSYYVIQSHKPALDFEPLSEVSDVGMSLRKYFDY